MKLRKNNVGGYVVISENGSILRWFSDQSAARRSARGKTVATIPNERSRPFRIGDQVTVNDRGDVEHVCRDDNEWSEFS